MISVRFQGKPLNITVIQVYAQTNNAEEAEEEISVWNSQGGGKDKYVFVFWFLVFSYIP